MKTSLLPDPGISRHAITRNLNGIGLYITAVSFLCLLTVRMPCAVAQTLPPGFREEIVFGGLTTPTAVEFASDGRVFVAEKSGRIKVFSSISKAWTANMVAQELRCSSFLPLPSMRKWNPPFCAGGPSWH